jgi:hypothetical protein
LISIKVADGSCEVLIQKARVTMQKQPSSDVARPAGSIDIRKILGDLDDTKIAEILALKPSLADLEDVAICMTGDHDVLAKSGHHVPVTAARIIELLADEEDEPESRK